MSIREIDVLKSSKYHQMFQKIVSDIMARTGATREEVLYMIAFRFHIKGMLQTFAETTDTPFIPAGRFVSFDEMHSS